MSERGLKVLYNDEIKHDQWEKLLSNNPYATPFQTPEFYDLFNAVKNLSAVAIAVVESESIKALAVITLQKEPGIKGFFSRRAIIYGGPIFLENNVNSLKILLNEINAYFKNKVIYIETRNFFDYSQYKFITTVSGWNYEPYLNFHLCLTGLSKESLFSVFNNDVRRRIKNSISEGATYTECNSEDELKEVYTILTELYKTKVKHPLPQIDFFKAFYNSGLMKVFVVKHHENIIGGAFCPYDKNGIYTFYYCDRRDYHKRISPTHLSILAAMEFGINQGIPKFDFMGAGKPGIPYSIRDFKKQFGGEELEQGRFIKVLNPILFKLGKIGLKILSTLH